jgi:hypothetical protein
MYPQANPSEAFQLRILSFRGTYFRYNANGVSPSRQMAAYLLLPQLRCSEYFIAQDIRVNLLLLAQIYLLFKNNIKGFYL